MVKGITPFGQLQALLPWAVFDRAVADVQGDRKVHLATCRSHFLVLLVAMLLSRQSLRQIERGLRGRQAYLKGFGVGSLDHNTLSHANRHRPVAAVEALFQALLSRAEASAPGHRGRFRGKHYSLDATEIRVSSVLFSWARCARGESGVKLHLFLDHDGLLPALVEFGTLRTSELALARRRTYAKGTLLCFDRGYFDTAWLRELTAQGVTFVTRLPARPLYQIVAARRVPPESPVLCDEIIRFTSYHCQKQYPERLRLITYYDAVGDRVLQFLTNQMTWSAETIARIYKDRWQIEIFFKWMKQNLKLSHLYSRHENGVRWQVLVALCLYLLLALLKQEGQLKQSLRELHGLLGLYLFDAVALHDLWLEKYQFQT